jgi:preprotein translocase subunit SecD
MSMVSEAPSADSQEMVLIDKRFNRQEALNVGKTPFLDLTGVKSAEVGSEVYGRIPVRIIFTEEASRRISAITRQNIGKRVAFIIDGKVFFAPVIRGPIGDRSEISGDFTEPEAKEFVSKINASVGQTK